EELMEKATAEAPLVYCHGEGMMLPAFEKQMEGLAEGEGFDFCIACQDAYGEYDDESVIELQKAIFMRDGKFDDEHVKEGYVIPLSDGQSTFNALVTKITDNTVTVDLNHPLAGEELTFKGKILENRPATDEELAAALQPAGGCGGGCDCCGHDHDCDGGDCGCGHCH
ncbi:MAG: peptidylprolyl isomerase, partial [Bacteroidaceae bacterium]|nr:peptidylprolyl isomerase [Bacteroidaceae bacterium]